MLNRINIIIWKFLFNQGSYSLNSSDKLSLKYFIITSKFITQPVNNYYKLTKGKHIWSETYF